MAYNTESQNILIKTFDQNNPVPGSLNKKEEKKMPSFV
jgi:hypothetical protein